MIFIAGASGFVGAHLVDALINNGYKLRCLSRSKKSEDFFREKGIEVVPGDITMPETLEGALDGIELVIHLVGIIEERKSSTFHDVHVYGTRNLAIEAKRAKVKHVFYQSALGADINSWSKYFSTKAEAEEIIKKSKIPFTVFRPSLIIGPWDGFTKKLKDIARLSPVIPIPGDGKAKFQPLYIKDWVKCALKVAASPESFQGIFELGGPQYLSYKEMVSALADSLNINKKIVHIPMSLMKFGVAVSEKTIPFFPVTNDQLRLLEIDNICDLNSVEKNFGFKPVKYKDALSEFISETGS